MPLTNCPVGVWTVIPPVAGDMLLETRGLACYVDTTGSPPANPAEASEMPSNDKRVIKADIPVRVQPAQNLFSVNIISNPV